MYDMFFLVDRQIKQLVLICTMYLISENNRDRALKLKHNI